MNVVAELPMFDSDAFWSSRGTGSEDYVREVGRGDAAHAIVCLLGCQLAGDSIEGQRSAAVESAVANVAGDQHCRSGVGEHRSQTFAGRVYVERQIRGACFHY